MSVPDAADGVVAAALEIARRTAEAAAELAMSANGLLGRESDGVSAQLAVQFYLRRRNSLVWRTTRSSSRVLALGASIHVPDSYPVHTGISRAYVRDGAYVGASASRVFGGRGICASTLQRCSKVVSLKL
jgi:hypothetical protein